MGDSAQTLSYSPAKSLNLSTTCPNLINLSSQTLDQYSSPRRCKVDPHAARSRMLFDEIAQHPEEDSKFSESKNDEETQTSPLMSTEVLEDSDEPLISNYAVEAIDDDTHNTDDETAAWISCNGNESEERKPVPAVGSSSSSWNEDTYEQPSMLGAGLANLGNTCFFNAVLQCFTHSVLLVQGLFSHTHQIPCDCSNERFCLICTLREHIERSLTSSGKSVSPWKLVDNLSYFSSSFQRYQQEDAHEFLQCFLDRLESSLNSFKTKDLNMSSPSDDLVKHVFGGRVISKLRCCNCNHISDTYEPSVDLSLEIEDAISLSTALESFTKVEHIEDEEMKFTCDHCKEKVSVEKQLMLDQIPPICAFHLKRFKNDGSHVEKIDKHVDFPLELDLQPYTCGSQSNNMDTKYELYAVIVHTSFTSTCGHYYCYIRSAPETWYKFDDSRVTSVSEACVLSEEAYILFYSKQDTPWFSNFMETYKPSLDLNLSNTSPKSVLENADPPNIHHSHDINPTKPHLSEPEAVIPLDTLKPINRTIKLISPLTLKEYGSNHKIELQRNKVGTPTRVSKPTSDLDRVASPSTPPRSPGLDLSDDENSEVVFAAKPEQMKLVEKVSCKRQRETEAEKLEKHEAVKMCKKMPGARAHLLLAALAKSSKSENSLKKKSKKMASPPRKNYSKSSEQFKPHGNSINRNLATTSFRSS